MPEPYVSPPDSALRVIRAANVVILEVSDYDGEKMHAQKTIYLSPEAASYLAADLADAAREALQ